MVRNKQKDKERYFVEQFIMKLELSSGKLIDSENPDFLFTYEDFKTLGLEVTEIHNLRGRSKEKFPPSQRQGAINKIVANAEKIFLQHRNLPLNLNLTFVEDLNISNRRARDLEKEIASILLDEIADWSIDKDFSIEIIEQLPKEIKGAFGYYHPISKTSIWYSAEFMWLRDIDSSEIEDILEKKNSRVDSYREKCDQVWLIIVEGIPPFSWYDGCDEILNREYETEFDRLFIYRNLSQEVFELKK